LPFFKGPNPLVEALAIIRTIYRQLYPPPKKRKKRFGEPPWPTETVEEKLQRAYGEPLPGLE